MVSGTPSFACSGPNGVTAEVSEALEPRLQQAAAKNLVLAKVEQEARQACVLTKPLIPLAVRRSYYCSSEPDSTYRDCIAAGESATEGAGRLSMAPQRESPAVVSDILDRLYLLKGLHLFPVAALFAQLA
jgi:hypothetical protein